MKRPDLPTHALLVSGAALAGEVLTVRFVSELQPDAQASGYVVHAFEPVEGEAALAFVQRAAQAGRPLRLEARGDRLALSTPEREELVLAAHRFSAKPAQPSMAELAEAMHRVWGLHAAEQKASRRNAARLARVRELLLEQARKVGAMAQGQAPGSEAAQLCAQQVDFIEKLFNETEA